MNGYGMIAADQALRLADERLDGYRRERAIDRIAAGQPKQNRFAGIAAAVSSARAAFSAVDTDFSLPILRDDPYRS
ncbi:MAG TPA: hypothetical protein VGQ58_08090 [Candidatus Limnocylindrales bacterium]|nr:hypothetical protein [Candidatus Limnocylindrales bacterium]